MLCSELMCSSNDTTLLSKADRSRPKNEIQSKLATNEHNHGIFTFFSATDKIIFKFMETWKTIVFWDRKTINAEVPMKRNEKVAEDTYDRHTIVGDISGLARPRFCSSLVKNFTFAVIGWARCTSFPANSQPTYNQKNSFRQKSNGKPLQL